LKKRKEHAMSDTEQGAYQEKMEAKFEKL